MPVNTPTLIGVPEPYNDSSANNSESYGVNPQPRGPRLFEANDAYYAIFWIYNYVPATARYEIRFSKSVDLGVTWTEVDTANSPILTFYSFGGYNTVRLVGTKVYVAQDYITLSGVNYTSEVRIYSFELTTELWDTSFITGPSQTVTPTKTHTFIDFCLRGTNEFLLLHHVDGSIPQTDELDIYNLTSSTWTTTGLKVFDTSTANAPADSIIWDGTYAHIFASAYRLNLIDFEIAYVTLSSTNTFGIQQNLYNTWLPAWINPAPFGPNHYLDLGYQFVIFGPKIYMVWTVKVTSPSDPANRQIICLTANKGEANPTWTAEEVYLPLATNSEYALQPILFVAHNIITIAYTYTTDYDSLYIKFTKRVLGVWTPHLTFYSYYADPPVYAGLKFPVGSLLNIRDFTALSDVGGPSHFGLMATLNYDYHIAVWFLIETPCDCTDAIAAATGQSNFMY